MGDGNPTPATGGRVPPSDLDAEAAVLSAILLNASVLDEIAFFETKHFYADANRRIYEACLELRAVGQPIDVVSVAGWLRDREKLQQVGGSPYLAQLADATPAVANVAHHARTVVRKWEIRQVIAAAQVIAAEGYGDVGDVDDWKQSVDSRMFAITRSAEREERLVHLADAAKETIQKMVERSQRKGIVLTGVTTGLPTLDARLGGLESKKLYVLAARPGMGKAQPLDAKILTPSGWVQMGDIRAGDLVIGGDGKPTRVKRVFLRGKLPVFRVTMDDGATTRCCDEHLWLTRNRQERRAHAVGTVKTLHEIRASLKRAASGGLMHSIPMMRAAQFASRGELPLHPYVLGVYLGDGSRGCRIDNPEQDVQNRFIQHLPATDKATVRGMTVNVSLKVHRDNKVPSRMLQALRDLGVAACLAEDKFIPEVYQFAAIEERLELLRGLCDTDGAIVGGGKLVEYSTVSKRLCDDIVQLVGALGGRATVKTKQPSYTYRGKKRQGQLSYRMLLSFPAGGITPVSSKKHLAHWSADPIRVSERFIKTVRRVGVEECRCIEVESPQHLYVTDDFIVTHNTAAATCMALACAKQPDPKNQPELLGDGVVFISVEMPRQQIAFRFLSQMTRIDSVKIQRGHLSREEWADVYAAYAKMQKLPIVIEDSSDHTPASIRAAFRMGQRRLWDRHGKKLKVKLCAIDYLQLLNARALSDNREQEIAAISRSNKAMAKDEDIAVLSLAQVNRDCEKRPDKRPQLSDLRESGAIEQEADSVIFIYREDYYRPKDQEKDDKAEYIVSKLRDNGGPGVVHVMFDPKTTTFYEQSKNPDYEQLGDMFDDYQPGQYGEAGSKLPEFQHWQDDYDK